MEFALVALLAGIGAYILWPALVGTRQTVVYSEEDTPLGRLAIRKEVLVGNLADLDFEFAMGKLSEDDYRHIRETLKGQTLAIMEQMDVLAKSEVAVSAQDPSAGRGGEGKAKAASFCSSCGGNLPGRAHFCPHCGNPV